MVPSSSSLVFLVRTGTPQLITHTKGIADPPFARKFRFQPHHTHASAYPPDDPTVSFPLRPKIKGELVEVDVSMGGRMKSLPIVESRPEIAFTIVSSQFFVWSLPSASPTINVYLLRALIDSINTMGPKWVTDNPYARQSTSSQMAIAVLALVRVVLAGMEGGVGGVPGFTEATREKESPSGFRALLKNTRFEAHPVLSVSRSPYFVGAIIANQTIPSRASPR